MQWFWQLVTPPTHRAKHSDREILGFAAKFDRPNAMLLHFVPLR
jgi:hypothetical protein